MPLPEQVEQTIQQIIDLAAKDEPELREPMHDELAEQFEALLAEEILYILDDDRAEAFQHLIAQEQPDAQAIQQFLIDNRINTTHITNLALNKLKEQYMEAA